MRKNTVTVQAPESDPPSATVGSLTGDSVFQLMRLHKEAQAQHIETGHVVYILQRKGVWTIQGKRRKDETSRYYFYKDNGMGMFAPNVIESD